MRLVAFHEDATKTLQDITNLLILFQVLALVEKLIENEPIAKTLHVGFVPFYCILHASDHVVKFFYYVD